MQEVSKGFYLAIRDPGSCLSIYSIFVFYKACPEATFNFIHVPETAIHYSRREKVIEVKGECVANAISVYEEGHMFRCEINFYGADWENWMYHSCHCKGGYQPDPIKDNTCTACPIRQFKSGPGGEKCPPYSKGLLP